MAPSTEVELVLTLLADITVAEVAEVAVTVAGNVAGTTNTLKI